MRVNISEPYDDGHCDIDVEIHPWDTWALDHTLALIIIPALEQLRDNSQSYPSDLEDFDEWVEVINKMLVAFENVIGDDVGAEEDYWNNERWKETQEGFSLFGKHYTDLWM
jgi:hypothetical protein